MGHGPLVGSLSSPSKGWPAAESLAPVVKRTWGVTSSTRPREHAAVKVTEPPKSQRKLSRRESDKAEALVPIRGDPVRMAPKLARARGRGESLPTLRLKTSCATEVARPMLLLLLGVRPERED